VLAFENGVLAFENGVLVFEKGVLVFENRVLGGHSGSNLLRTACISLVGITCCKYVTR
jgi:hypothetical protein